MAWEQTDEEIIAYLSGELTPSEKETFEQRLLTDAALADALDRHKAFEKRLQDFGEYQRKAEEIGALNEQFSKKHISHRRSLYVILAVAVLAVLVAMIMFVRGNKHYCPEELYTEAFVVRIAPDIAGQAQDAEQNLRLAHSRFNQQLTQEAIGLYQQALEAGTLSALQQEEAHFYLGQSRMLETDFAGAINHFGEIVQGPYVQLSQWNIALSRLAQGELEEAKIVLDEISKTSGHDWQADALALLKKWDKLTVCDTTK